MQKITQFQQDWDQFEDISPLLEAGQIQYIADTSPFFQMIVKNYPILCSRIDWSAISYLDVQIKRTDIRFDEIVDRMITLIVKWVGLKLDSSIFFVFDGFTQGGFEVNSEVTSMVSRSSFLVAQHTYIIPSDGSWCINYSFESYLSFGWSKSQPENVEALGKYLQESGLPVEIHLV